jgi:nitrogenase molybdenum-iron protein NifN
VSVGYRGTRDLIFDIGNVFMAEVHEPTPNTWRRTEETVPESADPRVSMPEELVMITELI